MLKNGAKKKKNLSQDRVPTTKEHLVLFEKYVQKHINKLGLLDWRVVVFREHFTDKYAGTLVNMEGRIISIMLNTEWFEANGTYPLNNANLKATAKHEVHHVLLARYTELAHYRFIRADELKEAEEEIIRVLDKFL